MRGYFRNSSGFVQLCVLGMVALASLCFALFLGEAYVRFFSFDLRSLLIIQNSFTICLTAFAVQYLITDQPFIKAFKLNHFNSSEILLGVFILVVSLPLIEALAEWNQGFQLPSNWEGIERWMRNSEDQVAQLTTQLLEVSTWRGFFLNIFQIAILAGICEELLFRGILQKILIRWTGSIHAGVWIAALLFSAVHLQFYGFIPRTLIGVLLGYFFVWSGNLWISISAHSVNNMLAVVLTPTHFNKSWHFVQAVDKAENSFWLVVASLILTCTGIYILYVKTHLRLKRS